MARPRRKRRSVVPGLTWRGSTAYWQREHHRFPRPEKKPDAETGRIYRSLRTSDPEQAALRAAAMNALMERGDWDVIARFASGELPIDAIVRAVREGEWRRLRKLHGEGVRLGEAADLYLDQVRATLSPRTLAMYASIVERAVAKFGASRLMHELSTEEAQSYLHAAHVADKPWSARTMGTQRTVLGALWKFAMEREGEAAEAVSALPTIVRNPWKATKAPKIRRTRFSYFRPEEARALLEHVKVAGTVAEAFLAVAIYAGLRLGEITHLRTDLDVVLGETAGESWIIVQGRDGEHRWRPKTERGDRKLRPIPALFDRLVRHRERFAGDRYFFKPETSDEPPHASTVTRWVQIAFAAAGIKYGRRGEALSLHSCRHTYATWQVAAGIPIPTVARRLGDTAEVVLKVYAHHMPEQDEQADAVLQAAAMVDKGKQIP